MLTRGHAILVTTGVLKMFSKVSCQSAGANNLSSECLRKLCILTKIISLYMYVICGLVLEHNLSCDILLKKQLQIEIIGVKEFSFFKGYIAQGAIVSQR